MITVATWPPGYHIAVPANAVHTGTDDRGITLTRDEAFELFEKLRAALAEDAPSPRAGKDGES